MGDHSKPQHNLRISPIRRPPASATPLDPTDSPLFLTFRPSATAKSLTEEKTEMLHQQYLLKDELLAEVTHLHSQVQLLKAENERLGELQIDWSDVQVELQAKTEELARVAEERDFYQAEKAKADEWAEKVNEKLTRQQTLLDHYCELLARQQGKMKEKEESILKLVLFQQSTMS